MTSFNWTEQTILVTGGTGSFGKKFARVVLDELKPKKLIIFSRDELKQHEMRTQGFDDTAIRYFIGDIRDAARLRRAFEGVTLVVHAAALKQVPACEYNPIEAIRTNIDGGINVIDAALDRGVSRVLALSTDKAVSPTNLYGTTKAAMEKLVVQSNAYAGGSGQRFSCVRYGNVLGSRGSIVPLFQAQRASGEITVTDRRMTRFWITLDQGIRFVIQCIERMAGGEVYVPKIPSMSVVDMARVIAPECSIRDIGIRPGEKLHEMLLSDDEARHTFETDDAYIIEPAHPWWVPPKVAGTRPAEGFAYRSDTNADWLTPDALRGLLAE